MDEELFLATQDIKEFKVYRVWDVTRKMWNGKKYTRKGDAVQGYDFFAGKKRYILVEISSISETKYEWI